MSDAVSARVFSWLSRLETLVPAEVATWMVDWPRCRDWITAFSDPEVPRSFWAMAQTAPLSCGAETARPVETSVLGLGELVGGRRQVLQGDERARIGVNA